MLYDTDIIIWIQKGNLKAAKLIDGDSDRYLSIISYMELLQNAINKQQQSLIKNYLQQMEFTILPLTEDIGHRASIYIEEYSLSHGISANDALIAATAIENNYALVSGNAKHYRPIHELNFKQFKT